MFWQLEAGAVAAADRRLIVRDSFYTALFAAVQRDREGVGGETYKCDGTKKSCSKNQGQDPEATFRQTFNHECAGK